MSDGYKPPFMMTEEITNLVIEIAEMTGVIALTELTQNVEKDEKKAMNLFGIYCWH